MEPAFKKAKEAVMLVDAGPGLKVSFLERFSCGLSSPPTPAAYHACRLAAQADASTCRAFFATGRHLYTVTVPVPHGTPSVLSGKEGMLIPIASNVQVDAVRLEAGHEAEIQSVILQAIDGQQKNVVASVASNGSASFTILPSMGSSADGEAKEMRFTKMESAPGVRERGWAGIAMLSGSSGASHVDIATVEQFGKRISVYQDGRLVRSMFTSGCPTAVSYLPSAGNLLAVAEEHKISLWDVRQSGAGGLVQVIPSAAPPGSSVFCMSWCGTPAGGLLGSAGKERAVIMTEPRKWRTVHKWHGCLKHSVHYLSFSAINPAYCYVAGLDNECVLGLWGSTANHVSTNSGTTQGHSRAMGPAAELEALNAAAAAAGGVTGGGSDGTEAAAATKEAADPVRPGASFRGDSRWLGMVRASAAPGVADETVVAYSQTGGLFIAKCGAVQL